MLWEETACLFEARTTERMKFHDRQRSVYAQVTAHYRREDDRLGCFRSPSVCGPRRLYTARTSAALRPSPLVPRRSATQNTRTSQSKCRTNPNTRAFCLCRNCGVDLDTGSGMVC